MDLHAFIVQVARAAPGLFQNTRDRRGRPVDPMHYILHCLPLVHAHGLLHTADILNGHPMTWPDLRLTPRGQWWLQLQQMWKGQSAGTAD